MNLFNRKDKLRICLTLLAGILIYFTLSVIVKLFGLDLFSVTNDIPILIRFNNLVMSNIFLEDFVRSLLLIIDIYFVYGICGRIDKKRHLLTLCGITFIIAYMYNLGIYYYKFPSMILSVIIPLIILLIYSTIYTQHNIFKKRNFNERLKSILTMLIFYVLLSVFIIIIQQILLYLKFSLLKFSFYSTNIFNSILFKLDAWMIYLSIYIYCKIRNKGEENDGR